MNKKQVDTERIKLPNVPVGARQPQYPINCYPITASDVIEVMARGITAYMNERLTKFHSIAYNPENTILRKKNEQLEADNAGLRKDLSMAQSENAALRAEKVIWDKISARVRAEMQSEGPEKHVKQKAKPMRGRRQNE